MIIDELLGLIERHEISPTDAVPQHRLAGSALRHQPELQMFAAVRALSIGAGYSEFESDGIASAVMTRLG
ncbi:hypothetical protein QZM46_21490 [Burkholderia vietnamiensis]|jgi:hypothetical protein|uniref:Uncharacterized protein n=3 Tax=Burkholderia cepacia complex TaxID=87882 RepID=A4JC63_BURVG|nr:MULTISPECIES: hypothetical protein [Burkholderia]ABO53866.1 conserved hypothetical protein [Burkholderia vietnamiensis G4]AFJ85187.1 hypothetical protein MYA_0820 [Burkholderia sp. KJ006]AJY05963.1 hypothetical protein AK36_3005 [Burkholderia vietnamiensis LMG 10929]AOJ12797.1 hypothetical protein WJ02_03925 [Burkholderia vietnamiensis]AOJ74914.1 hypothetical protein WJ35_07450 [Burkholderia ubonensis]